jgi:Anti-sigma-K factor rskA
MVSDDMTSNSRDHRLQEHCDPEVLALKALGEDAGTPADDAHLASCDTCRTTLESLAATAQIGRQAEPLESPSPHVWAAIQSELGLGTARTPAAPQPEPDSDPAPTPPPPGPTPLRSSRTERRRRRVGPLLAAAALVGVAGGVAATIVAERVIDEARDAAVVAVTPLDPLPDWRAQGDAQLVRESDGQRQLRVDLAVEESPTNEPGFREVWLIDRQVSKLVSLGPLTGTSGTFAVPEGLELSEYPVVDVSFEPYDGQPAHSGESIARGILPT